VSKPWQTYALHILDAAQKIEGIRKRGDLLTDEVFYAATLRHLQTLSEATQALPQQLKDSHPQIPWREISGFRNILVHNYLGEIDALAVLRVVENQLPQLVQAVQAMLADSGHRHPFP